MSYTFFYLRNANLSDGALTSPLLSGPIITLRDSRQSDCLTSQ